MPSKTSSTSPPPPPTPPDEEEDDYMSMALLEPQDPKPNFSNSFQRRKQKEKAALSASLPAHAKPPTNPPPEPLAPTSKGFALLSKLGYTPGSTLGSGSNPNALLHPLGAEPKGDKGGIGHESERKRKVREEIEEQIGLEKRVKADQGDYRERVGREREERRAEGMWWGGMKVLEGLVEGEHETERDDAEDSDYPNPLGASSEPRQSHADTTTTHPLKRIPLLYRPLPASRLQKERERRARYDLHQSLTRNANYDDPEEDAQDWQAFGREEEELEEEDEELEAYMQLEPAERLRRVVGELRGKWRYCFWCKMRYEDEGMEGCPGDGEEEHG